MSYDASDEVEWVYKIVLMFRWGWRIKNWLMPRLYMPVFAMRNRNLRKCKRFFTLRNQNSRRAAAIGFQEQVWGQYKR